MGQYSISAGADSPATAVLGCQDVLPPAEIRGWDMWVDNRAVESSQWRAEVQKREKGEESSKQNAALHFILFHSTCPSHNSILHNGTIRSHTIYPSNRPPLYPVSNLKIQDFIQLPSLPQPRLCSIAIHQSPLETRSPATHLQR